MLNQYTENDINRQPKLLKKWLSEITTTSKDSKQKKDNNTKVIKTNSR